MEHTVLSVLFISFLSVPVVFTLSNVEVTSNAKSPNRSQNSLVLQLISNQNSVAETSRTIINVNRYVRGYAVSSISAPLLLAKVWLGSPSVSQLMVMDTGSHAIWVQCEHCSHCFVQDSTMYDPSKSNTYQNLRCTSHKCHGLLGAHYRGCSDPEICSFGVKFGDTTTIEGRLGTEKFRLGAAEQSTIFDFPVPGLVFGCSFSSSLSKESALGGGSGVLGLDAHNMSLPSQLDNKLFSYCIGNLTDSNYANHHLIIGDAARFYGRSSPLDVFENKYYITLSSISVGEDRLELDPEIFVRSSSGEGGVVIDTGKSFTVLTRVAYEALCERVDIIVGSRLLKVKHVTDMFCFWGWKRRDMTEFPYVWFRFAGGAELMLGVDSLFQQVSNAYFCLAFQAAETDRKSTIGVMAQQQHNVAYDLDNKKLYLCTVECDPIL